MSRNKNQNPSPPASGFTLIEMLIAMSLVALVAVAVYANFESGIRVMKVMSRPVSEEDTNIFFEKISSDLQNSFRYKKIPFSGLPERVSFPAPIRTEPSLGGADAIGRVSYAYDSSRHSVVRLQENVSQIYQEKPGQPVSVLSPVQSLHFHYYRFDPSERKYSWVEEWKETEEKVPRAVRVELEIDEEGKLHNLTRTIPIPVGE